MEDMYDDLAPYEAMCATHLRRGPCVDDCEHTAPYVGIMPEESDTEHGSPVSFGRAPGADVGFEGIFTDMCAYWPHPRYNKSMWVVGYIVCIFIIACAVHALGRRK